MPNSSCVPICRRHLGSAVVSLEAARLIEEGHVHVALPGAKQHVAEVHGGTGIAALVVGDELVPERCLVWRQLCRPIAFSVSRGSGDVLTIKVQGNCSTCCT